MTINIFLAIFASVLFLTGAIGCMIADSDEEGIGFIGVTFGICSVIIFGLAFIAPSNYEIHFYHWLIFIFPLVFIIILIWNFFTKKYVLPWKRDYYREYRSLRKEFDTLQNNYNKLNKDYYKLEEIHQQEINNILNKTLLQINNNNPKLYL